MLELYSVPSMKQFKIEKTNYIKNLIFFLLSYFYVYYIKNTIKIDNIHI